MRNAFADELTKAASENEQIVLLSGDIGNRLFDKYKKHYPSRFFNCGVAEANMTGVAAGMALSGFRPITYTIAPFNTYRCLEQIKLDICYHNLPVIVIGVGAGLSYSNLGGTHQALEDIAVLRCLPNMTVICPGDAVEVRLALRRALEHDGPVYLRMGKKNEPVVHETDPDFRIGKGIVVREGSDICLLSNGTILPVAMDAAMILERRGISTQVVSMHTVKPMDDEMLDDLFARFTTIATVEEHTLIGGFGSAVAEWMLLNNNCFTKGLIRFGTGDTFLSGAGAPENARHISILTSETIAESIITIRR